MINTKKSSAPRLYDNNLHDLHENNYDHDYQKNQDDPDQDS